MTNFMMCSDILAELLDSVCDGHVDCKDLLTSITGSSSPPPPFCMSQATV